MDELEKLYDYIRAHHPALHLELAGLPPDQALPILNRETGMHISLGDAIDETAPLLLAALKKRDGRDNPPE